MEKRGIIAFLILVLVFMHTTASCVEVDLSLPKILHKRITRYFDPTWNSFFVLDADNNDNDDLLIDKPSGVIISKFISNEFKDIDEVPYDVEGCLALIQDIDGDHIPEYFTRSFTEEGFYIRCYRWLINQKSTELLNIFGPLLKPTGLEKPVGAGMVDVHCCCDLDGDGRMEACVFVNSYSNKPYPRTLVTLDALSGEVLHSFDCGPILSDCYPIPDPAHGNKLVVTTSAPQNHACWNGTCDSISYLFCLDSDLEPAWNKKVTINGGYCTVAVGDINRDGKSELVLCRCYADEKATFGMDDDNWSVSILDPADGFFIHRLPLYTSTHTPMTVDLFGDSKLEIVICGNNKTLYILDDELNILYESSDRITERLCLIKDLDRDGSKEIVCSGEKKLMVRDCRGNLKAEMEWDSTVNDRILLQVQTASIADQIYLVALNDEFITFYRYLDSPFATRFSGFLIKLQRSTYGAAALVLVGMSAGAAAIVLSGFRRKTTPTDKSTFEAGEAADDLLLAMTAYGHGGSSIKTLDRIRRHLANRERLSETDPDYIATIARLTSEYSSSILPELHSIASIACKAGVDKSCGYELLNDSEKAGFHLNRLASSSPKIANDSELEAALSSLGKIDRHIKAIRARLKNIFECNVVDAAIRILNRFSDKLEALEVIPSIEYSGISDQKVFLSSVVFEKSMENLLSNSIRAMEKAPNPSLKISISANGDNFIIDVVDSGCGLKDDLHEKVFDRQYTTKTEGGFGLYYAREELSRFGARIFIKESSPGIRTTVRMVLKRT